MVRVILALAFLLAITAGAEAGPFRNRGRQQQSCSSCNTVSSASAPQSVQSYGDDQSRCQQEADHMAARRINGHVFGTIGRFEGVGYGNSSGCATCTPEQYGYYGLRLTGDASALGPDGLWRRVRSWR
jgi:hypothetical protein